MIFVGLTLPADGEHGLLSIKSLSFLSANFLVGLYVFLRQKMNFYQFKLLCLICMAIVMLVFWLFVSLYRDTTTAAAQLDQFKLFLITMTVPLLTLYLVSENILSPRKFFKVVLYASMTYVTTKVILVALHLLGLIDIWSLMKATGIMFMRMSIYGGLDRVQTSVDIPTPFLFFFVLQSDRLGLHLSPFFKRSYIVFSLFSTFLSFSRYLLFVYFLSCCLYWLSLEIKGIVKGLVGFIILVLLAYGAIGHETVVKIIERRVFSAENTQSDETRTLQAEALLTQFEQNPFLGTGIGGYAQGLIREPNVMHLYEVQWMAFLMQFGLVGIIILLAPLTFISGRLVWGPFSRVRWSFFGLFMLWIFSGFTNPFLISLASGIMYSMFYLCGEILARGWYTANIKLTL